MKKIGIIGAGNMGSALYRGICEVFEKDLIYVSDKNQGKLDSLSDLNTYSNPQDVVDLSDVVILAVKPQSFQELAVEVTFEQNKLLISIMAGISTKTLAEVTGVSKVIRAMPSIAISVKQGVTGWYANSSTDEEDKSFTKKLFGAVGYECELKNEDMIDKVAALSPAYFFYLAEIIEEKAKEYGFSEEEARHLAIDTFTGSAELLRNVNKSPQALKEAVASKKGSTEAALSYLKEHNFEEILKEAIDRARDRWLEFKP